MHIRLCGRVGNKKFSLGRFPETKPLFCHNKNNSKYYKSAVLAKQVA